MSGAGYCQCAASGQVIWWKMTKLEKHRGETQTDECVWCRHQSPRQRRGARLLIKANDFWCERFIMWWSLFLFLPPRKGQAIQIRHRYVTPGVIRTRFLFFKRLAVFVSRSGPANISNTETHWRGVGVADGSGCSYALSILYSVYN